MRPVVRNGASVLGIQAAMDPEFRGLLYLCLNIIPIAILFSAFMAWVLCRMADEQLGYKEE